MGKNPGGFLQKGRSPNRPRRLGDRPILEILVEIFYVSSFLNILSNDMVLSWKTLTCNPVNTRDRERSQEAGPCIIFSSS